MGLEASVVVVTTLFSLSTAGVTGLGLNLCLGELNKETLLLVIGLGLSSTSTISLASVVVVVAGLTFCLTLEMNEGRKARGRKRLNLGFSVVAILGGPLFGGS